MWRTTILAKRCVQKSNHTVKTSTVVPYQAHVMPKMNYELTVSKKEKKILEPFFTVVPNPYLGN